MISKHMVNTMDGLLDQIDARTNSGGFQQDGNPAVQSG